MNTIRFTLLCAGTALFLFCSNPSTPEKTGPVLTYVSITGSSGVQKDVVGSGMHAQGEWKVTTKNANGLWSIFEEIGFYYVAMPAFNGTISADFKSLTGSSDSLRQGGLMIRGSTKGHAPYAALRLAQNRYDPVARPDSTADAASAGSTITFQQGDRCYLTCSEREGSGNLRSFDIEAGARRGDQTLISKKFIINTVSDSLYVGLFCADRSAAEGAFSVTNLSIQ